MVARIMPGVAKMIWISVARKRIAKPTLRSEQQHENQSGNHRRNGKGQIDEGKQQIPAGEAEFRDKPRRRQSKDQVRGQRDGRR